jgi:hypothetical protein
MKLIKKFFAWVASLFKDKPYTEPYSSGPTTGQKCQVSLVQQDQTLHTVSLKYSSSNFARGLRFKLNVDGDPTSKIQINAYSPEEITLVSEYAISPNTAWFLGVEVPASSPEGGWENVLTGYTE